MDAVRPVTVSVLDPPTKIEVGLKLQVAPLLQDRAMDPRKVLGPAAEMVKRRGLGADENNTRSRVGGKRKHRAPRARHGK